MGGLSSVNIVLQAVRSEGVKVIEFLFIIYN